MNCPRRKYLKTDKLILKSKGDFYGRTNEVPKHYGAER